MTQASPSDSQSSYSLLKSQKPPFEAIFNKVQSYSSSNDAAQAIQLVSHLIKDATPVEFQRLLTALQQLFEGGHSTAFMTRVDLMRKLMNQFTALGRLLETPNYLPSTESQMLQILSLLAELLRRHPNFYFPFTRKFVRTLLSLDADLIHLAPRRSDILAILAVLLQNFSRQPKLINKFEVSAQLKEALLNNYPLIEELFTSKLFNKAILNMSARGFAFTSEELLNRGVLANSVRMVYKSKNRLAQFKSRCILIPVCRSYNKNSDNKTDIA